MLITHPVPGKQKSMDLCNAFIAGAPKGAQGNVFYGVVDGNLDAWKKAWRSNLPYYWIDNSYFDCVRGQQFRITKGAIQVAPKHEASDGVRFARLGLTVKPWEYRPDGYWLLIEQSEVFMRLIAKDADWVPRHVRLLGHNRVVIRKWTANKPHAQVSLPSDLRGARMLGTHSSAAAVSAVLEGVPISVSPMHALWGMEHADRGHYLNVLADNQFTIDEMKDGSAYRWLNK